jgi:hypothetical protein
MCRCDATYSGTSHSSWIHDAFLPLSSTTRVYVPRGAPGMGVATPVRQEHHTQHCFSTAQLCNVVWHDVGEVKVGPLLL